MNEKMKEFTRKSRAAFDQSVEAMDAATRMKLARARAEALATLRDRRLSWSSTWVPAGAAAAAALAATMLWIADEAQGPSEQPMVAFEELDMVASEEDFDMLDEDPAFYAWAAGESADGSG